MNNERSGVYVIHEKSCQTQNAWNNARLDFLLLRKQMLRGAMALRELTVSHQKDIYTSGRTEKVISAPNNTLPMEALKADGVGAGQQFGGVLLPIVHT